MEKSCGRVMKKLLTIMIIAASAYNAICGGFYSPIDYTQCGWVKTTKSENGQIETKYNFSPGMSDDPKCSVYTEKGQNVSSLPSYASLDEAQSAALDQAIKKYNSDVPGKTLSEKQRNAEMTGSTVEVIKEDGTHAWINISLVSLSGEGGSSPGLKIGLPPEWRVAGVDNWHTGIHTGVRNGVKMTAPSDTDAKSTFKSNQTRSQTIFDLNDDGSYSSVRLKNNGEIWGLQNGQWTRIDNTPDYRAFCGDDGRKNTKQFLNDPENDRSEEPYCPPDDLSSQTINEGRSSDERSVGRMTNGGDDRNILDSIKSLLETGEEFAEARQDMRDKRHERHQKSPAVNSKSNYDKDGKKKEAPMKDKKQVGDSSSKEGEIRELSTVDNNTENNEPHEAQAIQEEEDQKLTIDIAPIYGAVVVLESIAKNGAAARIGNINQAAIKTAIESGDKWYKEQKAFVSALPNNHPQKAEALEFIEEAYADFCKLKDEF